MVPDTFPALFFGYTTLWVLLGLYIIGLGFRLASIEKKLSQLDGKESQN